jgi:hypothetical protein
MQKTQILEAVLFELNQGEDREMFLMNANVTQLKVEQFDGFIQRQLFENSQGQWLDLVWWKSHDQAIQASEQIMHDDTCLPFMQSIRTDNMQLYHLNIIDMSLSTTPYIMPAKALEAVFFKPRADILPDRIMSSLLAMQKFLESKTGYLHRQVNESNNQWLDLVWWESFDIALEIAKEIEKDVSLAPHFSIFEGAEMTMLHFVPVPLGRLAN